MGNQVNIKVRVNVPDIDLKSKLKDQKVNVNVVPKVKITDIRRAIRKATGDGQETVKIKLKPHITKTDLRDIGKDMMITPKINTEEVGKQLKGVVKDLQAIQKVASKGIDLKFNAGALSKSGSWSDFKKNMSQQLGELSKDMSREVEKTLKERGKNARLAKTLTEKNTKGGRVTQTYTDGYDTTTVSPTAIKQTRDYAKALKDTESVMRDLTKAQTALRSSDPLSKGFRDAEQNIQSFQNKLKGLRKTLASYKQELRTDFVDVPKQQYIKPRRDDYKRASDGLPMSRQINGVKYNFLDDIEALEKYGSRAQKKMSKEYNQRYNQWAQRKEEIEKAKAHNKSIREYNSGAETQNRQLAEIQKAQEQIIANNYKMANANVRNNVFAEMTKDARELVKLEKQIASLGAKANGVNDSTKLSNLKQDYARLRKDYDDKLVANRKTLGNDDLVTLRAQSRMPKSERDYVVNQSKMTAKAQEATALYRDLEGSVRREASLMQQVSEAELDRVAGIHKAIQAEREYQAEVRQTIHQKGMSNQAEERRVQETARKSEMQARRYAIGRTRYPERKEGLSGIVPTLDVMDLAYGAMGAIQSISDTDASYAQVQRVAKGTPKQFASFHKNLYKDASSIGKTAKEYADAVAEWATAGFNLKDSIKYGKSSSIGAVVGDMNLGDTVGYMQVALNSYKHGKNKINDKDVINVMNEVSNQQPITADNLGKAYKLSASPLSANGTSFAELTGMITAAEKGTRAGGDVVGRALKSIGINLQNIGLGATPIMQTRKKFFDEKGIALQDANGQNLSTYQIMKNISKKWKDLSKNDRQKIAYYSAGKEQASQFSAIMKNWGTVERAKNIAQGQYGQGTNGSAYKEFEKQSQTIEFHLAQLKNKWEGFVQGLLGNREGINAMIDTLGSLADVGSKLVGNKSFMNVAQLGLLTAGIMKLNHALKGSVQNGLVSSLKGLEKLTMMGKTAKDWKDGKISFADMLQGQNTYLTGKQRVKRTTFDRIRPSGNYEAGIERGYGASGYVARGKQTHRKYNLNRERSQINNPKMKLGGYAYTSTQIDKTTTSTEKLGKSVGKTQKVMGGLSTAMGAVGGVLGAVGMAVDVATLAMIGLQLAGVDVGKAFNKVFRPATYQTQQLQKSLDKTSQSVAKVTASVNKNNQVTGKSAENAKSIKSLTDLVNKNRPAEGTAMGDEAFKQIKDNFNAIAKANGLNIRIKSNDIDIVNEKLKELQERLNQINNKSISDLVDDSQKAKENAEKSGANGQSKGYKKYQKKVNKAKERYANDREYAQHVGGYKYLTKEQQRQYQQDKKEAQNTWSGYWNSKQGRQDEQNYQDSMKTVRKANDSLANNVANGTNSVADVYAQGGNAGLHGLGAGMLSKYSHNMTNISRLESMIDKKTNGQKLSRSDKDFLNARGIDTSLKSIKKLRDKYNNRAEANSKNFAEAMKMYGWDKNQIDNALSGANGGMSAYANAMLSMGADGEAMLPGLSAGYKGMFGKNWKKTYKKQTEQVANSTKRNGDLTAGAKYFTTTDANGNRVLDTSKVTAMNSMTNKQKQNIAKALGIKTDKNGNFNMGQLLQATTGVTGSSNMQQLLNNFADGKADTGTEMLQQMQILSHQKGNKGGKISAQQKKIMDKYAKKYDKAHMEDLLNHTSTFGEKGSDTWDAYRDYIDGYRDDGTRPKPRGGSKKPRTRKIRKPKKSWWGRALDWAGEALVPTVEGDEVDPDNYQSRPSRTRKKQSTPKRLLNRAKKNTVKLASRAWNGTKKLGGKALDGLESLWNVGKKGVGKGASILGKLGKQGVKGLGKITISAKDNASKTINKVQKSLKKLTSGKAKKIKLQASDKASSKIKKVNNSLKKIKKSKKVKLSASDKASSKVKKVNNALKKIKKSKKVTIKATDKASSKAKKASNAVRRIPKSRKVTLKATDKISSKAKKASSAVQSIPSSKKVKLSASDKITAKAKRAKSAVDSIRDKNIKINATSNVSQVVAQVNSQLSSLKDKTVHINVVKSSSGGGGKGDKSVAIDMPDASDVSNGGNGAVQSMSIVSDAGLTDAMNSMVDAVSSNDVAVDSGNSVGGGANTDVNNVTTDYSASTEEPEKVDESYWRYMGNELYTGTPLENEVAKLSNAMTQANEKWDEQIKLAKKQIDLDQKQIDYENKMRGAYQDQINDVLGKLRGYGFKTNGNQITNLDIAKNITGDNASKVNELLGTYQDAYSSLLEIDAKIDDLKTDKWQQNENIKDYNKSIESEKIDKLVAEVDRMVTAVESTNSMYEVMLNNTSSKDYALTAQTSSQSIQAKVANVQSLMDEFNKLSNMTFLDKDRASDIQSSLSDLRSSILDNVDAISDLKTALKDNEINNIADNLSKFTNDLNNNISKLSTNITDLQDGLLNGQNLGDLSSSQFSASTFDQKTAYEKSVKDRVDLARELDKALETFSLKNVEREKAQANAVIKLNTEKYKQLLGMANNFAQGQLTDAKQITDSTVSSYVQQISESTYSQSGTFDGINTREYLLTTQKYAERMNKLVAEYDKLAKTRNTEDEKSALNAEYIYQQLSLQNDMYKDIIKADKEAISNMRKKREEGGLTTDQLQTIEDSITNYQSEIMDAENNIKNIVKQRLDYEYSMVTKVLDKYNQLSNTMGNFASLASSLGLDSKYQQVFTNGQYQAQLAEMEEYIKQANILRDKMNSVSEGSYEYNLYKGNLDTLEQSVTSSIGNVLDTSRNLFNEQLQTTQDQLEKAINNGKTADDVTFDRGLFYEGAQKELTIEAMRLKINELEDKTISKRLEALSEQKKLSAIEADYVDKMIDVQLAQQKLTKAETDRNVQTLTKRSDGTFQWEYIANQTDVDNARLEYNTARQGLEQAKLDNIATFTSDMNGVIAQIKDQTLSPDKAKARLEEILNSYEFMRKDLPETFNAKSVEDIINTYNDYLSRNKEVLKKYGVSKGVQTDVNSQTTYNNLVSSFAEEFKQVSADLGDIFGKRIVSALDNLTASKAWANAQKTNSLTIGTMNLELPNVQDANDFARALKDLPSLAKQMATGK